MLLSVTHFNNQRRRRESRDLVRSGHRLTIKEMVDELNSSFYAVGSILRKDLNMRRVLEKLVPKLLPDEQK